MAADGSQPKERWPLVLWTAWGAIIAALVLWLDKNPWAAAIWLAIGIVIGALAPQLIERLSPFMESYAHFSHDEARQNRQWALMFKIVESAEYQRLVDAGKSEEELCEFVQNGAPESAEYKRLSDEESFGMLLSLPVLLGLIHGSLADGIVGALCPLDSRFSVTAWQGAALGVVVGPIVVSFVGAITCAVLPLPIPVKLSQRLLMLVSPLLAIPAAWRCLTGQWQRVV